MRRHTARHRQAPCSDLLSASPPRPRAPELPARGVAPSGPRR